MKSTPLLALLPLALLLGCASAPTPKRYTVFSPVTHPTAAPQTLTLPYTDVRLRMAEDLRAYSVPLFFHADGSVTQCRAVTYYAPLEVALTRALREITTFAPDATLPLNLEVRDYGIFEIPATDATPAHLEIRVTLAQTHHASPPMRATRTLPLNATPDALRAAFADTLLTAYTAICQ